MSETATGECDAVYFTADADGVVRITLHEYVTAHVRAMIRRMFA